MKILSNTIAFGKSNKISAVLALLIVALVALGCNSKPEMPKDSEIQSLVKATTSDFTGAIDKGDFKDLRDKASKDFQTQFSEDTMKSTFKPFMDQKDVVLPILQSASGKTPEFSPAPAMREENGNYILTTLGSFDTTPGKTTFTYEYVWRDSAWKLLTLKYDIK